MSTENRVESNLSALVAKRSFRPSIDNVGMGFQEELLSLTFESQTEFSDLAREQPVPSSSVDQSQNSSDETDRTADEEIERPERENHEFALPLPLPLQPISSTQTDLPDLETSSENAQGSELVKGTLSAEKLTSGRERPTTSDRVQSNVIDRGPIPSKAEKVATDLSDQQVSTTLDSKQELPELNAANEQTVQNQVIKTDVESTPSVDTHSTLEERELKKPTKKSSSDSNGIGLAQDSEPSNANAVRVEKDAKVAEFESSQDSLSFDQDVAPTRNRRVSRQDRLREESGGDSKRDTVEQRESKDKELGATKEAESIGKIDESNVTANQFDAVVVQTSLTGSAEINYSLAGQAVAGQAETVVVNAASNAGGANANVTAALAGPADRSFATDNSSIQPLVAGSGKGDPASAANRGTGRAEGATGSSTLSRFQQNKLVQRVLKGLEQLSTGGGQVKLRLHPPELGTLQMTLKIEANVMSAHLEVENSLAKDALLTNLQSLRDKLSEQGMSIDRFEVEVRTDSQSGAHNSSGESASNRQSRRDQPESRYAIYNDNRLAGDTIDEGKPSVSWFRTTGNLDLSV